MRTGKASQAVLDRCVRRALEKQDGQKAARPGKDASLWEPGGRTNLGQGSREAGWNDLAAASVCGPFGASLNPTAQMYLSGLMNHLIAEGADPQSMTVCPMLPADADEKILRDLMERIGAFSYEHGLKILGGHTQVEDQIRSPQLALTMWGRRYRQEPAKVHGALADCDLVMAGTAGRAGTAVLAFCFEKELKLKFPGFLVRDAIRMGEGLVCREALRLAQEQGALAMYDISFGGVFGALWELGDTYKFGMDLDLKKIPIRQETIEICEFLDLNPYQLYGQGAVLIITKQGKDLVRRLLEKGIPAQVLGRTTDDIARIIRNGEEVRYLEKPVQDMLWQLRDRLQNR